MNFYALLESALTTHDIDAKERSIRQALTYCNTGKVASEERFIPLDFVQPSYAGICKIVAPKDLPKRRSLQQREGLALQLHAILHIEYSAIDLAMDAVYRFPSMPAEYRQDWLEVASDEVRHFRMLRGLLNELGYDYGDFPVHRGLFDASCHTAGDVLDRMAVIPRHYEATGLDVNPRIADKLEPYRENPEIEALLEALRIIYEEEIDHVRKGDRWFRWICGQRELDPEQTFLEILARYGLRGTGRIINVRARKDAGFSCSELLKLGAQDCEG